MLMPTIESNLCFAFKKVQSRNAFTVSRNAVSISDGPRDRSTGRIFFYLTDFDQTAIDLKVGC